MIRLDLDVTWHAGSRSPKADTAPAIQVHHCAPGTVILRQNKAVHYEAPFLFLLLGAERALLLDTGATPEPEHFPLRSTVDELIGDRPLLVAHTHSHDDHTAADGQFADRPDTVVVGTKPEDVIEFFGFENWPDEPGTLDLGGRVLDLIPGPGHHPAGVVFHDRATELLLTGDTVLPGRLYVFDWAAYTATIERLIAFCDNHSVSHVLGCHVEMGPNPGDQYPIGAAYQPGERPLQMTVDQLRDIRPALDVVAERSGMHVFKDFVIYHPEAHIHL